MFSQDQKEKLQSFGLTILECYKVLISSLLVIFVPQFCDDTQTTCSLSQNIYNLTNFNTFVLAFNFLTLFSFIILYFIQLKRETYIISHLDVDKSQSDISLEDNLKSYPNILKRIRDQNLNFLKISKITTIIFNINIIFSIIIIFYYYYDGWRSVTTFITNVLLSFQKLTNSLTLDLSYEGKTIALSSNRQEPVSYNVIDIDYKNILELTNPVANIKTIFKAPTKPGVDSEKVEEK